MRYLLATLLLFTLAVPAEALGGRYRIQGCGPEGTYRGTAELAAGPVQGAWRVGIQTFDSAGRERRAEARAFAVGRRLRFVCRAVQEQTTLESPLRAELRPLRRDPTSLVVTYRDRSGRVVRRECWLPDATIRIPVALVALSGDPETGFPGVGPVQAKQAQAWILAQLDAVYEQIGVQFQAVTAAPVRLNGALVDRNHDGSLSPTESRSLRDILARRGIKRPGRVVLAITAAHIVGEGCRGWTLGDAPPSPSTLTDLNDNFSIVGLRFLDPLHYHTVPHEVGHQLGLDDIGPENRQELQDPCRDDHLMISGGTGIYLDPVVCRFLHRVCERFPNHGLDGVRPASEPQTLPVAEVRGTADAGLPAPDFARLGPDAEARR